MPRHIDQIIAGDPHVTRNLTEHQTHILRLDGRGLEGNAEWLIDALAEIRGGHWDAFDTRSYPGVPAGASQRQLMENALYAADKLIPQAEALRAWALHGLRTYHGHSHEDIARILGVSRGTAQSRWRAIEHKRPALWDWARGSSADDSTCDNLSVGVIVEDEQGRVLVIERATTPWGIACPSGHGTGHGRPGMDEMDLHRAIGAAELHEETCLYVQEHDLELLTGDWRDNRCGRPLHEGARPGHQWSVLRARRWWGTMMLNAAEVRNAHWYSPTQLQELVDRTIELAHGRISAEEFRDRPGAEPVWVRWWRDAGYVRISTADLDAVEALAAKPSADIEEP